MLYLKAVYFLVVIFWLPMELNSQGTSYGNVHWRNLSDRVAIMESRLIELEVHLQQTIDLNEKRQQQYFEDFDFLIISSINLNSSLRLIASRFDQELFTLAQMVQQHVQSFVPLINENFKERFARLDFIEYEIAKLRSNSSLLNKSMALMDNKYSVLTKQNEVWHHNFQIIKKKLLDN